MSADIEALRLTVSPETPRVAAVVMQEIDERLQELKMQEEDWKKKCEEMEENANRAKSIVRLNVGGQRFETSKMTLMGNPFFKAMLESGIWQPENDGSYFLDRNPQYFAVILEYLRTGTLLLTEGLNEEALDKELEFYQVNVKSSPTSPTPVQKREGLLSSEHVDFINGWLGDNKVGKLIYNSSLHGTAAKDFHIRCDDQGPTVVVLRSKGGYLFGGHAADSWGREELVSSPGSYVFTLHNPNRIPPMRYFPAAGNTYELRSVDSVGPLFGNGDLSVTEEAFTRPVPGTSFPRNFVDRTGFGDKTFTGDHEFQIEEMEVYAVEVNGDIPTTK
ncbi:K+ channel tetramerization domain-containing protein [Planoprotostelium fungivorum]|uniref:K+ channel tetramerization domain-containing protein n=1 Tax=Planoprotostelium fungivorum TaxID=1890364 RepID=A0A2P6NRR2_9EUKA|nr:K+ channel tetramerization domain-containing protein [Planoprotostelium fungivorum]